MSIFELRQKNRRSLVDRRQQQRRDPNQALNYLLEDSLKTQDQRSGQDRRQDQRRVFDRRLQLNQEQATMDSLATYNYLSAEDAHLIEDLYFYENE